MGYAWVAWVDLEAGTEWTLIAVSKWLTASNRRAREKCDDTRELWGTVQPPADVVIGRAAKRTRVPPRDWSWDGHRRFDRDGYSHSSQPPSCAHTPGTWDLRIHAQQGGR